MIASRPRPVVALLLALGCGSDNLGSDDASATGDTGANDADPTGAASAGTSPATTTSGTSGTSGAGDAATSSNETGSAESTGIGGCDPPASLHVLFIGNSFTFTHDLPGMVSTLGDQAGVTITTQSRTVAGMNLAFHVANPATREAIDGDDWDYVVIQGHSLETINDLDGFVTNGQTLVDWVEAAGAQPLLYQTWARAPGHELYDDASFDPADPDEMQAAIGEGYATLSELTGAPVVPAGDAWQRLWMSEHIADIDPWGRDDYHPSVAGTYLNASVFFVAMTQVSLDGVRGRAPVDATQADVLHDIAHEVVAPCGARQVPSR